MEAGDNKLLLIQCLMLIYWENKLDTKGGNTYGAIESVVRDIKLPEATLDTDINRDIIIGLRSTVLYYCDKDPNEDIDKTALLQRIKINTKGDPDLASIISDGFTEETDQSIIRKKCLEYSRIIHDYRKEKNFKETVKKMVSDILYNPQTTDHKTVRDKALEITAAMDQFSHSETSEGARGIQGMVNVVNMASEEEVSALFKEAQEETSTDGIMRTGWQAINRMTGWYGGIRRGDFVLLGALQHNFKSGFIINLIKHFALYNKPYLIDKTKKPMLLSISSENALTDNLALLYQSIKENETGEPVNIRDFDREAATKYVVEKLGVNGFHVEICRVNPSEFTYQSLFDLVMYYESQGYEIISILCDYLNMFSKVGCDSTGGTGADVRDLFRRVRNFMTPRKITFITPHQISTEAKYLLRNEVPNFVKEIANKGYWDSCKTIDQEVDLEILIHIEKSGGRSYLTVARGKHRKAGPITPEEHLYTVLPFHDVGAIRDDIHGEDLSIKKVPIQGMMDDADFL